MSIRFFFWRPLDKPHRPGPGDVEQERDELAMTDRLVAADVEDAPVARVGGACQQERRRGIVNVHEIAQL